MDSGSLTVVMVLSGMGNMDMVKENVKTFSNFKPLSKEEEEILPRLRKIIRDAKQIPCTACSYCTEICPKNIPIPTIFGEYNNFVLAKKTIEDVKKTLPADAPKADECIKCGKCEKICPQSINIRDALEDFAKKTQ